MALASWQAVQEHNMVKVSGRTRSPLNEPSDVRVTLQSAEERPFCRAFPQNDTELLRICQHIFVIRLGSEVLV